MKQVRLILTFFLLSIVGTLTLSGCGASSKQISRTGFYFNTVITITIYDEDRKSVLDDCFALADKYENLFSTKITSSDIYKINHAGGAPVTVDDEIIVLLQKGLIYANLSDGLFDITIGSLSSLWNFSENNGTVPDAADIQAAVSTVDYHGIIIEGNTVTLTNPDTNIDLGGIAKGYIADKLKELLHENGIHSGIINLGGNVLTVGPKENGNAYKIGIKKPFSDDGSAIATVKITDETVVSSGVYERYFYVDDTLYHHILNPATGYPIDNDLLGVTIICNASVDGDALSTTCLALGLDAGMQLIESLPDTEAIFITSDYIIHKSSGIGTTIPFEET